MSYTPKTEEQLAKEGLLEQAVYDAEVVETDDRPSKAGNEMFTLKLRVYHQEMGARVIFDYIALGNNFGERKLRHAANSCGLLEEYNAGSLKAGDFLGKYCKVLLKQSEGKDGYMPKNVVGDYILREEDETPAAKSQAKKKQEDKVSIDDDSIPF